MKGYNIIGLYNVLTSLIYTKICHRKARLIRLPVSIRGSENIDLGEGLVSGRYCRIDALSKKNRQISFGNNCQINDSVHIAAIDSINIGDNVLIASRVFITDHQHGCYSGNNISFPEELASQRRLSSKPVTLGNNVWVGEGVCILPGVSIGDNSIIGANSVVTKSLPKNVIACGNPVKVIKEFDERSQTWRSL
ncbi:acetyltransferase [Pseudoalteromonas aurantia]|uniref:DapH/DapD/GlmU-related protein n=1 Tax=Pseudoalteromonas aurantia TaxID=43654 RepID=UPI00110A42B0|nr:DapH/DapD/GlmU-related protein [Pseudoalteromonas aurantia]TMO67058.1 acetyltransferase [Pseudoalteromonas aurantia]